jgi:hypothetical protein
MGYILAKNELHHRYWRSTTKPTITISAGTEADGHGFVNSFDDNAATSLKISGTTQLVVDIDFGEQVVMNGFAIYGHNFDSNQGIQIKYDTNLEGVVVNFQDDGSLYDGTYLAGDKLYRAFGAHIDRDQLVRRLQITTVGWDANTFMSNFAIGRWVDGVNISAPFTPPIYEPQMAEIKRNNKGNPLLTDTRKMPQKFSINLATLTESDIFDAIGFADTINGHSADYGFAEYFGYYLPRFPFYLMYDDGSAASTDADTVARRNRIWYAVLDNQSRQPSYNTPTTLNWRIPVVGYIS